MPKSTRIQILLVACVALIYGLTPTADYYWDGITFALQIEKVAAGVRGASLLFHQNHLLYNAFGYLIYCAAHAVGLTTRALTLLQWANTLLAAFAVGTCFRIAERILRNHYIAVICAASFAVSVAWWKLATDADAYVLSILLVLLCIANLVSEKPRWHWVGLSLAGAMLVHQLASLLYPVAILAILYSKAIEKKRRFAVLMSITAWLPTILAYYLCAAWLNGIYKPLDVVQWAVSNPSGVAPALNPVRGILLIPSTNVQAILGHRFHLFASHIRTPELICSLSALALLVIIFIMVVQKISFAQLYGSFRRTTPEMNDTWQQIGPVLITWVVIFMAFLVFWEPWQVYYRAYYLPALALLLGTALKKYHAASGAKPSGIAALMVAAVMLMNMAFYIGPLMRRDSNGLIAAARNANSIWGENTIIYYSERGEADTAFEYFNEKTKWQRFTPAARLGLDDEVERIAREGGSIWLNKGAAESVDGEWLARHARGGRMEVTLPNGTARYVQLLPSE
jgi:hypothetical protein